MTQIKLNNMIIGRGRPPFIVAEAGINHNGEIDKALKMIKVAKEAGADAIKFQTFKAEEVVNSEQTYSYISQGKEITESMFEMFKRCEFSKEEWFKIKRKCDEEKILFLSTPQNRSDLDLLLELGIPAIKIGSDDFTNLPLLKDYSITKLPLIVSSGMADLAEIYNSLKTIGSFDNYPTILLVTTSQYPTPPQDVNLLKFSTLSATFPMIPLGFSDHTQGILASSLAVAFGACFFEKHFTLDHNLPGPDHWFSEDVLGLKTWIDSIRMAYLMMGNSIVEPTVKEQDMKKVARRSIVTLNDIEKGDKLNNKNIGLLRPGNGLPSNMIEKLYGLTALQKIQKGKLIKFGDFG